MTPTPVGQMLRSWRKARRMSQLELALDAEISTKHLSFLETGRSRPSREMVLLLGSAMDLPLRARNALLLAAGLAPAYPASDLSAPALQPVRSALEFLLRQHEPNAALVVDNGWNVVLANDAHVRFMAWLLDMPLPIQGRGAIHSQPPVTGGNLLHALLNPEMLRPLLANFDSVAAAMLAWVARDAASDPRLAALLDELSAYPDLPDWRRREPDAPGLLELVWVKDGRTLSFFSMLTAPVAPQDVLLEEIRVETFFPADDATAEFVRTLQQGG